MSVNVDQLSQKIQTLRADQLIEVANFVEFLRYREHERSLVAAARVISAPAFDAVWDNEEDAAYDAL